MYSYLISSPMPLKLDKRDRRLLLELDKHCRRPLKDLARLSGGAIETTRYRIERLTDSGIIKNFLTVVDGGRLGFYYYKVFFRFFNVDERKIQSIIEDLKSDPRICWVVRIDGNYDVGFTPRVHNPREQSEILEKFRWKYSKYIKRWTQSVNLRMDFMSRDYLLTDNTRSSALGSYSSDKQNLILDEAANLVLSELARTPRASASSIAARCKLSVDTVLSRMRFLEKEKVIVRYSLVTDVQVMEHVNFYVLIYLNNTSASREKAFVAFCQKHPNIVYLIKSLGEWDYELSIEAPSVSKYREVMNSLSKEFSDIVQEYSGMMVERLEKYVYP